jgi:hypothetical protein
MRPLDLSRLDGLRSSSPERVQLRSAIKSLSGPSGFWLRSWAIKSCIN